MRDGRPLARRIGPGFLEHDRGQSPGVVRVQRADIEAGAPTRRPGRNTAGRTGPSGRDSPPGTRYDSWPATAGGAGRDPGGAPRASRHYPGPPTGGRRSRGRADGPRRSPPGVADRAESARRSSGGSGGRARFCAADAIGPARSRTGNIRDSAPISRGSRGQNNLSGWRFKYRLSESIRLSTALKGTDSCSKQRPRRITSRSDSASWPRNLSTSRLLPLPEAPLTRTTTGSPPWRSPRASCRRADFGLAADEGMLGRGDRREGGLSGCGARLAQQAHDLGIGRASVGSRRSLTQRNRAQAGIPHSGGPGGAGSVLCFSDRMHACRRTAARPRGPRRA